MSIYNKSSSIKELPTTNVINSRLQTFKNTFSKIDKWDHRIDNKVSEKTMEEILDVQLKLVHLQNLILVLKENDTGDCEVVARTIKKFCVNINNLEALIQNTQNEKKLKYQIEESKSTFKQTLEGIRNCGSGMKIKQCAVSKKDEISLNSPISQIRTRI